MPRFTFHNPFAGKPGRIAKTMAASAFVLALLLAAIGARFVLRTLDAAFTVPDGSGDRSAAANLITPALVERVRAAREAKLAPSTGAPTGIANPFDAPTTPPPTPTPPPAAPATPDPATPPPAPLE